MPVLIPDLVWRKGAFEAGLAVQCSAETGRITRIGPAAEIAPLAADEIERLPGRALLPGFIDVHSHAFQRAIRGRGQWKPPGGDAVADFWSWREAMYVAALDLSPDDIFAVSLFCFVEMLRAGWTTVGEFHYLHRDERGGAYEDPCELAHRVIAAAETAGIRICLLNVAYVTGGIGESLRPEQRRFATPDLEDWLTESAELAHAMLARPLVTVGLAPHSVRAVPRDWLRPAHELAYGYDLPLHTHASEQQAEVAACLAAYGMRPVELLADAGVTDELLTVVHATHVTHREIALLARGPTVCACPTTERDLGDGFLPGLELRAAGASIALGTDSNAIIDPFEEMRLLEYHERLRRQRRIVLGDERRGSDRYEVGRALLDVGTRAGARSLRIEAGAIEVGALADLVTVDLEHRTLAGWTPRTLAAALSLAAPADVVTDVWVGGVARVMGRHHPLETEAAVEFRVASARLPD